MTAGKGRLVNDGHSKGQLVNDGYSKGQLVNDGHKFDSLWGHSPTFTVIVTNDLLGGKTNGKTQFVLFERMQFVL